jgi:hypothetical protein
MLLCFLEDASLFIKLIRRQYQTVVVERRDFSGGPVYTLQLASAEGGCRQGAAKTAACRGLGTGS